MKKLTILSILLLLVSTVSFSSENVKMRAYTDYSPVKILYIIPGYDADLEANKAGLHGGWQEITIDQLPKIRTDRDSWKFSEGRISSDPDLKEKVKQKNKLRNDAFQKAKATLTEDEMIALNLKGAK